MGYREQGIASWYGEPFHGRRTSNGEVYNMYGPTAAHKTLPMHTILLVRNLDNGRSTVVRINDRGPFVRERVIDLSYTKAQELGVLARGTARVEIVALEEMEERPAASVAMAKAAKQPPSGTTAPQHWRPARALNALNAWLFAIFSIAASAYPASAGVRFFHKKRPSTGAFLHHDWLVGSVAGTALNSAATLRLGLMLAEMPLRAGTLAAASQAGAASETLGS